ncbi:ABC-F family ATP-binding cassette domain-containing protein [Porphyromonas macacae]|uniref:Probable ATP-binding protein YbiT n=1 Tax=Porphyromonas macacae TaxID=28115 RepID=A0A379DGR4_9PORP|nr:ABC-F family ATP-binding cassette domain-containing protein [Porphyromonas macacae]SUB77598.1 Uncharacterized ABC transporter ATP-binding protein YheS [Porphyromonas macacae]
MISVNNVTVDFGTRLLFDNVSFVISNKDKIALVGRNGAGKSTLLKLIAKLAEPTSGHIARAKELRTGYLPQHMQLVDEHTVYAECETAFSHIRNMQADLDNMSCELSERTDYDSESYLELIERFTALNERMNVLNTGSYHAEIERTLIGLGFERSDFERPTAEFSGGWRMRIELAKLLLRQPDILLLDEPTNHLDIESIQWLESFIARSRSAMLLVSHDKAFIDNTTNRTIEIELGRIYDYKTNYSHYIQLREERLEQQRRAYENQQKAIKDTEEFIERFRYKATKSVQVQSRIKQLEKVERIELDEIDRRSMHFRFIPATRSGSYTVIIEDLQKAYGDHIVFDHANITIKRGEKVAFAGKNGAGKSTMVKCIMGEITDYTGKLELGHLVEIGYFAQNEAQLLNPNLTVYETIDREAQGDIRLKINDLLGAFMFGGEESEKKVSVLSGGEKGRLAMIKLLLRPANLLILDEPTNHLDIRSKEVLKEAINNFEGTVILVSHDREFLQGLVSKVYEFSHGKVIEHLGGIYDWINRKKEEETADINERLSTVCSQPLRDKTKEIISESIPSYRQQKEEAKKSRALRKEFSEIEHRIEKLETELKELETALSNPANSTNNELFTRYDKLKREQNEAMNRWEELALLIEE